MLDALDEDQVKKQLNDAKLRGVAQRVEYDDFEKLVKGAHLRPVKPRSTELDEVGKAFDGFVMPKVEAKAAGPALPAQPAAAKVPETSVPSVPTSSNEFLRVWRRQLKTSEQRFTYLRQLEPATLPILFRTELDAGVFDSIIAALADPLLARADGAAAGGAGGAAAAAAAAPSGGTGAMSDEAKLADDLAAIDVSDDTKLSTEAAGADAALRLDLAWAHDFLYQASRLNRFDLTLDFADKKTIEKLTSLFDVTLREGAKATGVQKLPDAAEVASVRAMFKA